MTLLNIFFVRGQGQGAGFPLVNPQMKHTIQAQKYEEIKKHDRTWCLPALTNLTESPLKTEIEGFNGNYIQISSLSNTLKKYM